MSILNQIPKPSFIFDPTMANESRGALAQVRRVENETGQGDPAFTRNSSKWVVNKAGILVEVPENVPAVGFDKGFPKGYLAETGGTNVLLQSQKFNTSPWTPTDSIVITENFAIAPDGTQTANRAFADGDNGRIIYEISNTAFDDNVIATHSFFAKYISGPEEVIFIESRSKVGGSGSAERTDFNIKTGEITSTSSNVVDANIEHVGSGWYRCSHSFNTESGSSTIRFQIRFASSSENMEHLWWGAQSEQSPVATSYIPTEGSTASRGADNLIFENAEDLIGQQSGVVLVELDLRIIDEREAILYLDDGTTDTFVGVERTDDTIIRYRHRFDGGTVDQLDYTYSEGRIILLGKYTDSEITLWANGGKVGEESISTAIPLNRIMLGRQSDRLLNDHIRKAYLWNNADWLTDELAERLTS